MTFRDEPGTPGDSHLDHALREALSPAPEQAERIALRALSQAGAAEGNDRRRSSRRPFSLVPVASLVVLLAGAAMFLSLQLGKPRPDAVVSIVNVGGMVIVTSEEEDRPLILSGEGEPQAPGIILIRHGGSE